MKVYLDTSVLNVWLFGREQEAARYAQVCHLVEAINAEKVQAVVSLYSLQEICVYCQDNFPAEFSPTVARLAVHDLLNNQLALVSLLSRMERLIYGRRFSMADASDQSHAVIAFLQKCDAIITYDTHYQAIAHLLPCKTPEEIVEKMDR